MTYKIPHLGLRMVKERTLTVASPKVTDPAEAAAVARKLIGDRPSEHLIALLVDGQGNLTGVTTLAQGGMHGAAVTAAHVMRCVLAGHASAFILSHNHPSGDPSPSDDDIIMTARIVEVASLLGVQMLDHIIVTRTDAYKSIASGA